MYNLIPLVIIVFSMIGIIVIVVRKFPALANLDLETVQAEKEKKMKELIISSRMKRTVIKWYSYILNFFKPISASIHNFFKYIYERINTLKDKYKKEKAITVEEVEKKLSALYLEAEDLERRKEFDLLEKKLIEIIGLDSHSLKAFKMLGEMYVSKKNFTEAKETFKHVLKLIDNEELETGDAPATGQKSGKEFDFNVERSHIFSRLAEVAKDSENKEEAIDNISRALVIEPNNPRYLDMMLEISIINKDKIKALDAYNKLVEVNPDNQKLAGFKEEIDKL